LILLALKRLASAGAGQLMQMAGTFKALNARSAADSGRATAEFGRFFLGELWDTYVKAPDV
jgi:hypothetical protein